VAEVEAFQQSRAFFRGVRDDPVEHALGIRARVGVILRQAACDQQQQRPDRVGPPALRPLPALAPTLEHPGHPAVLDGSSSLPLPDRGWLVEQIAHDLPADDGIAIQQPLDHGVIVRHGGDDNA
jgi:hypothetical protein